MKKYYNIPYAFYVIQLIAPPVILEALIVGVINQYYEGFIIAIALVLLLLWLKFLKKLNYIIFDEDKFKIKVCFFKKNGEHPYDDVKKVVIEGLNVHCGLSNIFLHFEDKKDIVRFYSNKKLIMEVIRRFPDRISIEGNYVRHQIEKIKKEMDNK